MKALVVGGGIAGLTASIALSREGVEVELAERAERVEALGSGITMVGPALRVLHQLDLLDRCLEQGWGTTEFRVCNTDGELLQAFEMPQLVGPDYPGMMGIMRPALHAVLLAAAREDGVRIRTGLGLVDLRQSAEEIVANFGDGHDEAFDLLVGADGWQSTTRRLLFGEIPLRFESMGCYRALVPRPEAVDAEYVFEGHGHAHPGFTPLSESGMYMFCVFPAEAGFQPERDRLPELMRGHLADFGGMAGKAREHIRDPALVDYRPLYTQIVPKPWHSGRAVLIGDAAHTPTPQLGSGAALGLEDATVLAEEMATDSGDVPAALARLTERRFERCNFIIESSRTLSHWQAHPDTPGADRPGLTEKAFGLLAEPA